MKPLFHLSSNPKPPYTPYHCLSSIWKESPQRESNPRLWNELLLHNHCATMDELCQFTSISSRKIIYFSFLGGRGCRINKYNRLIISKLRGRGNLKVRVSKLWVYVVKITDQRKGSPTGAVCVSSLGGGKFSINTLPIKNTVPWNSSWFIRFCLLNTNVIFIMRFVGSNFFLYRAVYSV